MQMTRKAPDTVTLDQRRSRRVELRSPGDLVLAQGRSPCFVMEISRYGGRIQTDAAILPGDDGLLQCDGLDLLFRAVRMDGACIVVEFIDELAGIEGDVDPDLAEKIKANDHILRFLDL